MTNYFKELECPNYAEINDEILAYVMSTGIVDSTLNFWNPLPVIDLLKSSTKFLHWLNKQNLRIASVALTVANTSYPVRIHIDTPPARFKISWPILNSTNSFNRWFEVISQNPKIEINALGGIVYTDITDLREVCQRRVDFPAIIDAGIPHDVVFNDEVVYPRLGLQCQLIKEPESL